MLQEVCQSALVLVLVDRTDLLCDIEACHMLREIVFADVVGQSVVQMTNLHLAIHGDRWHLLCRRWCCTQQ